MAKGIESFGPVRHPTGPNVKRTSPRLKLTFWFCVWVPLCLVVFPPIPSSGHVLPGQQLLLLMTKSLGSAAGLEVHQRTLLYEGTDTDPQTQLSETLTYRFSNAFRCESVASDLKRIHVDTLDAVLTVLDDHVALEDESRFDRYEDLLLFHSRILLQERLTRRGIDTMISSLGRFEGTPFYILGAQYPDMTTAQIWIEKETFHPFRLLLPVTDAEGNISILEFRYLLWQKNRKLWYPMQIECYENDRLIRKIVVDDMVMNPVIDNAVFDISRLRMRYAEKAADTQEDLKGSETQDDIQKALDDFKKRYE